MFTNKTILITGASSGLGRVFAEMLSRENANLVLFARNSQALKETANLCGDAKRPPLIVAGDVTNLQEVKEAVTTCLHTFKRLDHLILNAGVSMWTYFEDLPHLEFIRRTMDVNYHGAVNFTHYALPFLKESQGLITVISSLQGKIGTPYHTGYAASKHALHGFFDSLRIELRGKVDILMACPGWIQNTSLKSHALKLSDFPTEKLAKEHAKAGIALDVCVNKILRAMLLRKREWTYPHYYYYLNLLKMFTPNWLDQLIRKKVEGY